MPSTLLGRLGSRGLWLCLALCFSCQSSLRLDGVTFAAAGGGPGAGSTAGAFGGSEQPPLAGDDRGGLDAGDGTAGGAGGTEGYGVNLPLAGSGGSAANGADGGAGGPVNGGAPTPAPGFDDYSFQRGPSAFVVSRELGLTSNDAPGALVSSVGEQRTLEGGRVAIDADGGFTYWPPTAGFWGDDGFDYAVGRGRADVRLRVQPGVIELGDVARGDGNGFAILTEQREFAGSFVADAGDVNGDGRGDLLVAAPNFTASVGRVYVVFGKADRTPVWLEDIASASSAGFVIDGVAANDFTGRQVAGAGDVNGDGRADILVGTAEGDVELGDNSGFAYVVFGKPSAAPIALADLKRENAGLGFAIAGAAAGDSAGRNVSSVGDFNGDGLADVAIGAQFADDDVAGSRTGAAYVVFGKRDTAPVDLAAIELGGIDAGVYFRSIAPQDLTGASVSGADVNGDGLGDVIIGAPDADRGGPDAGHVYVVFGRERPVSMSLAAIVGGFTIIGERADSFGRTASGAGDVNGDGFEDVLIGGGAADPHDATVHLIFGKADEADVWIATLGADASGFAIEGVSLDTGVPGEGHFTGSPVSRAGDVDGDDLADVIIGAYGAGTSGAPLAGAAHVLLGAETRSALDVSELDGSEGSPGWLIRGQNANGGAGFSVAGGGDVDGDGLADVIVGAPGVSDAALDGEPTAIAFVLFGWDLQGVLGSRNIPVSAP